MKNKLMIIGIAIILMLASSITDVAAIYVLEATLTLSTDKNEVKAGETFTVTLKATCPDGINGVVTTYSYDEDKLEYVSENIVDSNYSFGGNKNAKEIFVYCTSTDSIQSADVYAITFRVKEGVEANSIATISLTESTLDSDAATDSEHTIPAQQVNVTIIEEPEGGQTPPPAEDEGGEQTPPPAEDEGGEQTPPPAEDEDGEQTPPPAEDEGEDKNKPTTGGTTVVVGDDKDNTTANKEYNKAGINIKLGLITVIIAFISIIMYVKNKKYKDII